MWYAKNNSITIAINVNNESKPRCFKSIHHIWNIRASSNTAVQQFKDKWMMPIVFDCKKSAG